MKQDSSSLFSFFVDGKRISFASHDVQTRTFTCQDMTAPSYYLLLCTYLSRVQLQAIDEFKPSPPERLRVTILGALTRDEHIHILDNATNHSDRNLSVSSRSFVLNSNPLLTTLTICKLGNSSRARVIIAGCTSDKHDLTLTAISFISDFYHIPVLTIGSRENLFSDQVKIS